MAESGPCGWQGPSQPSQPCLRERVPTVTKDGSALQLEVDAQSSWTLGPALEASVHAPAPLHLGGLPGERGLARGVGSPTLFPPSLGGMPAGNQCANLSPFVSPPPRTQGHTERAPHPATPMASGLPGLHEEPEGERVFGHPASLCACPGRSGGQRLPRQAGSCLQENPPPQTAS